MYRYEIDCPDTEEGCRHPELYGKKTEHHLCPRSAGKLAVTEAMRLEDVKRARLIRKYIESPYNKAFICRCLHDVLDGHPEDLPSEHTMQRRIDNQPYSLDEARSGDD